MFTKTTRAFEAFKTKLHPWDKSLKGSEKRHSLQAFGKGHRYLLCVVILVSGVCLFYTINKKDCFFTTLFLGKALALWRLKQTANQDTGSLEAWQGP